MCIILTESPDSCQTTQSSRNFISMKNTEIRESYWQFFVGSLLVSKHQAMSWAVHWLHSETSVFSFQHEDVFLVLFVVTRSFPQLKIEHIWRNNLLETTDSVLFSNQIHKLVVNKSTFWVEECRPWRELMSIKKSLGSTNGSVIPFSCFLFIMDVLIHFCFTWEGNTINSLKGVVFSISKPVG